MMDIRLFLDVMVPVTVLLSTVALIPEGIDRAGLPEAFTLFAIPIVFGVGTFLTITYWVYRDQFRDNPEFHHATD